MMSKLTKEEQEVIQAKINLATSVIEANRKEANRLTALINTGQVLLSSPQGKYLANLADEIARQEDEKERLEEQLKEAQTPLYDSFIALVDAIEAKEIDPSTLEFYTEHEYEESTQHIITEKDEYSTVLYHGNVENLADELLERYLKIQSRKGW